MITFERVAGSALQVPRGYGLVVVDAMRHGPAEQVITWGDRSRGRSITAWGALALGIAFVMGRQRTRFVVDHDSGQAVVCDRPYLRVRERAFDLHRLEPVEDARYSLRPRLVADYEGAPVLLLESSEKIVAESRHFIDDARAEMLCQRETASRNDSRRSRR